MKIERPAARKGRIEMIPLIDCMFIVLVFFIYAMLSMTVRRGIDVQLPQVGSPKVDQDKPVVISVEAGGQLAIGKQPLTMSQLEPELKRRVSQGASSALINADRDARHGVVTRVWRRVSEAGINRVVIPTDEGGSP